MSLTLLYRGKNVRFAIRLKKVYWLSALTLFALISGIVIHLIISSNDFPVNNSSNMSTNKRTIANQFSYTNEQYTPIQIQHNTMALTLKLAELQSQVLRLNALGSRLAADANIPEKDFNFSQPPSSGGPLLNVVNSSGKSFAQLLIDILSVKQQLIQGEKQLSMLESLALGHHIQDSSYLSGRPIKKGWLSSYFGIRKDPFTGRAAMHKGVDFAGVEGSDVIATASGVVSWASRRYGYGNLVEINHGNGIKTRYGHNEEILVHVGDVVEKGQVIAHMGSTGRSTGPHVHYEILRKNKQINPLKFVYRKALH
ncbi:MAG: M23 family metallopeptidase [Woeseiaceae bacterium]